MKLQTFGIEQLFESKEKRGKLIPDSRHKKDILKMASIPCDQGFHQFLYA